jgi:hypothetical protein
MMGVKIRKLVTASRSNLNGNNTYMHGEVFNTAEK